MRTRPSLTINRDVADAAACINWLSGKAYRLFLVGLLRLSRDPVWAVALGDGRILGWDGGFAANTRPTHVGPGWAPRGVPGPPADADDVHTALADLNARWMPLLAWYFPTLSTADACTSMLRTRLQRPRTGPGETALEQAQVIGILPVDVTEGLLAELRGTLDHRDLHDVSREALTALAPSG